VRCQKLLQGSAGAERWRIGHQYDGADSPLENLRDGGRKIVTERAREGVAPFGIR
jgi:hypothetical protein